MPPMSKREEYQKRMASAKERAKETSEGFARTSLNTPAGVKFWNPKTAGVHRIEIIPYLVTKAEKPFVKKYAKEGQYYYERTYYVHQNVGADIRARYVCPMANFGKKCAICAYEAELKKDYKKNKEEISRMRAKERQLFNVYDYDDTAAGAQVWDVSTFLFGNMLNEKIAKADPEDEESYAAFFDFYSGLTLRLTSTDDSYAGNDFLKFTGLDFKVRKQELPEELLDQAHDLAALIKPIENAKLEKIFLMAETDDEESPEVEEESAPEPEEPPPPPAKAPAKTQTKTAAKPPAESPKTVDKPAERAKVKTAAECGISLEDVVDHPEHGRCVVKHVSGDGTSLRLLDKDGTLQRAIKPSECVIVDDGAPEETPEDGEPEPAPPPAKPASKPTSAPANGKPAASASKAQPAKAPASKAKEVPFDADDNDDD